MMRFLVLSAMICLVQLASAQNLVPNPSFEDTIDCPYDQDQIHFAMGWSKYSYEQSTPDYFNACANPDFFGMPNCGPGYQQSKSGQAHAAVLTIFWPFPDYREHIGIQLNSPLIVGEEYHLSFYAVMGEVFGFGSPSNNIGIRLSTVSYSENDPAPVDNISHLNSSAIINDTVNWHLISGSMVADSAYNYLIVGNFFDAVNTDTLSYDSMSNQSYYYIDDICLSPDPNGCPMATSVAENELEESVLSPNPASDHLEVSWRSSAQRRLAIYDITGRVIWRKFVNSQNLQLQVADWPRGHYVLVEESDAGRQVQRFVLM